MKKRNQTVARLLSAAVLAGVAGSASAAPLYWDANATAPVNGGTGNWTGGSTWATDASGTSYQAWADGNDAVFGATAASTVVTQNEAAGVSVSSLQVGSTGYTFRLNGGNLTAGALTGAGGTGSPSAFTVELTSSTTGNRIFRAAVDSGTISTAMSLTADFASNSRVLTLHKVGDGVLNITGTLKSRNTSSDSRIGLSVTGGTLSLTGATIAANSSFIVNVASTGTLDFGGRSLTASGLNAGSGATLTDSAVIGATLTVSTGNNVSVVDSQVTGSLNITKVSSSSTGMTFNALVNTTGKINVGTPTNSTTSTFNASTTVGNVTAGGAASVTFNSTLSAGSLAFTNADSSGTPRTSTYTFAGPTAVDGLVEQITTGTSSSTIRVTAADAAFGSLASSGSAGKFLVLGNIGSTTGNENGSASTLTVGGDGTSTAYAGVISDRTGSSQATQDLLAVGHLTKVGGGTLTLSNANTYTGQTNINGGTLQVSGSVAGHASVNRGTLDGNGDGALTGKIAGTVTVGDGTLNAGNRDAFLSTGGTGIGQLVVGSLVFNGVDGVLKVDINGTALTGDRIIANGVDLNGAQLQLIDLAPNAAGAAETLLLIDNTSGSAIGGTFAGLAEGAELIVGGYSYSISYVGGVGNNDVVLAVPEPGSIGLIGVAAAMLLRRRSRR